MPKYVYYSEVMNWKLVYTILSGLLSDKQNLNLSSEQVDTILAVKLHHSSLPMPEYGSGTYAELIEKRSRLVKTGSLAVDWSSALYDLSKEAPQECQVKLAVSARQALESASQMISFGIDEYSGLAKDWIQAASTTYDECKTESSPAKPRSEPIPRTIGDLFLDD